MQGGQTNYFPVHKEETLNHYCIYPCLVHADFDVWCQRHSKDTFTTHLIWHPTMHQSHQCSVLTCTTPLQSIQMALFGKLHNSLGGSETEAKKVALGCLVRSIPKHWDAHFSVSQHFNCEQLCTFLKVFQPLPPSLNLFISYLDARAIQIFRLMVIWSLAFDHRMNTHIYTSHHTHTHAHTHMHVHTHSFI